MFFNEYTHKILYEFFVEEIEVQLIEMNMYENQNNDVLNTSPPKNS